MHAWLITPYLVLSGVLFLGLLQGAHAAPEVRVPASAKPKLTPRPLPGFGPAAAVPSTPSESSSSLTITPLPLSASPPTAARRAAPTPAAGAPHARILMIYRRGTPGLPNTPASTPTPKISGTGSSVPSIVPRAGQVRIITKAEAEALAAAASNPVAAEPQSLAK
jgi:hypothetical protein